MILFRITREVYARDLTGRGGLLSSARWHDHLPVIYTSLTSSTTILEKLVHLQPDEIHHDLMIMKIEVADSASSQLLEANQLPAGWNTYPAPALLKNIGNAWLTGKTSLMLYVPSVIDPMAQNVLINPLHLEIDSLKIIELQPFTFDHRLLRS
ncbi:MAG: RES domain-containing protein [Rickettsiales bacterium]|nr:MAG: RES domain-containing protein [Rickettsiales bacterium]